MALLGRSIPGSCWKKSFWPPLEISGYRLAQALGVSAQAVSDILLRKRGISAEMAIRLGKVFGMSAQFWMNLQSAYELAVAQKSLRNKIGKVKPLDRAA